MKWTMRHYFPFDRRLAFPGNSLLSEGAWDSIRVGGSSGGPADFFLPENREQWLEVCRVSAHASATAADIAAIVRAHGCRSILSVGVGRGCVEYHLKMLLPEVLMTCTECSEAVVGRLRAVFTECDHVSCMDLRRAEFRDVDGDCLLLLNRVDTELGDDEWRRVFERLAAGGVRRVLVVATGLLTWDSCLREWAQRVLGLLRGQRLVFAGYTRTGSRFRDLWLPHFTEVNARPVGGLPGYDLKNARLIRE
jgi:hypothetical protein